MITITRWNTFCKYFDFLHIFTLSVAVFFSAGSKVKIWRSASLLGSEKADSPDGVEMGKIALDYVSLFWYFLQLLWYIF